MSGPRKLGLAVAAAVLALLPAAVSAAPVFVVAAAFASFAGYSAAVVFALQVAAVVFGSIDARRKAKRLAAKARAEYNGSLQDRSLSGVFPNPPWRIVYGTAVTGGDVVAMFTTDKTALRENGTTYVKPDALRHLVVHLATHKSQAIGEVYLDGVPIGALDGNGWVTGGEFSETKTVTQAILIDPFGSTVVTGTGFQLFGAYNQAYTGDDWNAAAVTPTITDLGNGTTRITNPVNASIHVDYSVTSFVPYVRVSKHLGDDNQTVDTYLNGLIPTQWTTNHRLRGLTYIVLTLDLENQRFQGGPPNITASLSGRLVLDPRTGQTVHTENNALCVADWLQAKWGFESSAGDVDTTYLNAAANDCDAAQSFTTNTPADGQRWDFLNAAQSWTVSGATLTVNTDSVTVTSSSSDPVFRSPALSPGLSGTIYRYVRARVRRLAGTGWQGTVYYTTGGHSESESFKKTLANPGLIAVSQWVELEWDMHALTAGGSDWATSTITRFRIDLGSTTSDSFEIDWVAVSKPVARYTCNGAFTSDQDKTQVLEDLCESMAGFAIYGAKWQIAAGVWKPPVLLPDGTDTLTDDDLVGQLDLVQAGAPSESLFSGVRGTFIPRDRATPEDFEPYQDATFVVADAEELWDDVSYTFTDDKYRCKNLARIKVERARNGLVVKGAFKLKAWPLQVGDRVKLNNAEYGFSQKTFRVTDWQFNVGGFVVLTLQEDSADAWDLAPAASADPTPNSDLPNPWVVAAPTNVQAVSGTAQLIKTMDGSVVPRVLVTWGSPTSAYVAEAAGRVEVMWRRGSLLGGGSNASLSYDQISLPGTESGAYIDGVKETDRLVIKVRFRNALGRESPETVIYHVVVGKTQPPANVTGLTNAISKTGVEFRWDLSVELDYDETELRVGGSSWSTGTRLFRGRASGWTWPAPAQGTYTVRAKHFDTSGNESATEAVTVAVVNSAALTQWNELAGRPKVFRVAAAGLQAVLQGTEPISPGLYDAETGAQLYGSERSYMMARIRRSDGAVTWWANYDVYGSGAVGGRSAASLAADLNATGSDHLVVIYTYDEPFSNRFDSGLPAAMYRCGASQACFGSPEFNVRSAYILVGIPGCGEGNGHEAYQGAPSPSGDPNAWCDVSFTLQFGNFQIGGSSFTPRTLKDYSYTGSLNATSDLTLIRVGGGGTQAGNAVTKGTGTSGWDTAWYSQEVANGGAYATGSPTSIMDGFIALKDASTGGGPAASASYQDLDYGFNFGGGGQLAAYELNVGTAIGSYVPGDQLMVTYDGQRVQYLKNGTVLRTVENVGANRRFHHKTVVYTAGATVQNLSFGQMSPVTGISTPQLADKSATDTVFHNGADGSFTVVNQLGGLDRISAIEYGNTTSSTVHAQAEYTVHGYKNQTGLAHFNCILSLNTGNRSEVLSQNVGTSESTITVVQQMDVPPGVFVSCELFAFALDSTITWRNPVTRLTIIKK